MEEVKNEEVTEEVTQETPIVEEVAEEQKPEVDLSKFESKDDDDVIKVDLSPITDPAQTDLEEVISEVEQESPVLVEVQDTVTKQEVMEVLDNNEDTGKAIPENVQKLMDFMDETGGDLNDYVNLNRDVSELDNEDVMLEYYKRTKPHLDAEEINFLMEDSFSFDESLDSEKDIKRKKLALKEQVAEAKTYLDGEKSKYYEEIKAGSKLTKEQQEAVNFFNRYNEDSEQSRKSAEEQKSVFNQKTKQVFNDEFKGFEYKVGDKRFKYNIKDVGNTMETQSDINNFVKKFLNDKSQMEDAAGYHKSLHAAMNPDAVAKHFYEQGKADALKDSVARAKNVNMDARPSSNNANSGGLKFKVLGDDNSPSFKYKIKNKK